MPTQGQGYAQIPQVHMLRLEMVCRGRRQHASGRTEPLESSEAERPAAAPTTAKVHLELLTSALVHEGVTTASEGASMVRVVLLLGVGVVASVKAGAQLRVTEDLVGLVDGGHLLLGLLLGHALLDGLVRVELLRGLAVSRLDLPVVRVIGHAEDLVVVLGLAALQGDMGFLQHRVDMLFLVGVVLGCRL